MDTNILDERLSEASARSVKRWLSEPLYAEYRDELEKMINAGEWKHLEDAFFKDIEFGTAGRRGTTGIGPNRINKITIGESAQALCAYIQSYDPDGPAKGIVIACDTRLSSPELSQYTAQVCAANGFKTYIFDSFRSTPELSFSVRHLQCAAGIVISASHNPPADNGFKVCWSDGGQLVAPHDKGVLKLAGEITEIKVTDFDEAVQAGTITIIGGQVDDAYVAAASAEAVGVERQVKIAYSPLHGAGQTNVLPVLAAAGFTDILTVKEQMVPDGNFPTIENGKPNPEERSANDRVVALMMSEMCDIAITNDPDADRIGAIVRQGEEPVYLSGNQTAVLATDFALQRLQAAGTLTPQHYIVKTIVTTDMLAALATHYDVKLYGNLLIGFKYIGEVIRLKESSGEQFVTGSEESFGLLKGMYARDKDGASGALLMAEYAADLKAQGKTLYDRLLELYKQHGLYIERLENVVYPGADGYNRMQAIMTRLRSDAPAKIGSVDVTAVYDYQSLQRKDMVDGSTSDIDCIQGNVIALECGDPRRRLTIRPSGTEPKIKVYAQWYDDVAADADVEKAMYDSQRHLEGLSKELEGWLLEG